MGCLGSLSSHLPPHNVEPKFRPAAWALYTLLILGVLGYGIFAVLHALLAPPPTEMHMTQSWKDFGNLPDLYFCDEANNGKLHPKWAFVEVEFDDYDSTSLSCTDDASCSNKDGTSPDWDVWSSAWKTRFYKGLKFLDVNGDGLGACLVLPTSSLHPHGWKGPDSFDSGNNNLRLTVTVDIADQLAALADDWSQMSLAFGWMYTPPGAKWEDGTFSSELEIPLRQAGSGLEIGVGVQLSQQRREHKSFFHMISLGTNEIRGPAEELMPDYNLSSALKGSALAAGNLASIASYTNPNLYMMNILIKANEPNVERVSNVPRSELLSKAFAGAGGFVAYISLIFGLVFVKKHIQKETPGHLELTMVAKGDRVVDNYEKMEDS